jgi:uncharacterized protein
MITRLRVEEARELLRQGKLGRLGCVVGGEAYVVPVNYLFDGECIYIHSLPGRKITALRAHPRACLQVDEIKDEYNWRSVLAFGNYEEIADPDGRERVLRDLFARLPYFTPVESRMTQVAGLPEIIVCRIRVDEITGVNESWT